MSNSEASADIGRGSLTISRTIAGQLPLLTTICLAPLVGFLIGVALTPFFPAIAQDLGTSVALLGQTPAVSMLAAAALGLVVGPLGDHYGHRRLLVLGSLAVVVSALGSAVAPSYLLLLVAALIGSLSRAIVQPIAIAIAGERFAGDARRLAVSLVVASVAGSAIVGVPAMTAIASAAGWRAAIAALALVALGATALGAAVLPADGAPRAERLRLRGVLSAYGPLLRHGPTLGLIGSSLLRNAGTWAFFTYFGAYLIQVQHLTLVEVGWAYIALGLAFFVGSTLVGSRLGGLPSRLLLIASSVLQAIAMVVALLAPLSAVAVIATMTVAATVNAVGAPTVAMLLLNESPAGRATTMTLNQSAFSLGIALGSAVGGLLLGVGGYAAIAYSVPAFFLVATASIWLLRPLDVSGLRLAQGT
jgi:MFS transporter, DHA1 family, inner membrane transport protein